MSDTTTGKTNILDEMQEDETLKSLINSYRNISPVFKCNPDITKDQESVLGTYLVSLDDNKLEETLKDKAVMSDLDYDTILFFEKRHVAELCKILTGVFMVPCGYNIIPINTLKIKIKDFIEQTNTPHYYEEYKAFVAKFCNRCILLNHIPEVFVNKIKIIMTYFIFIPYVEIDELVKMMLKEFEESVNEGNGKTNNSSEG